MSWVADHRKHHQFSDQDGDPHSPHVGVGDGFWAAAKNLFHAHVGWLFVAEGRAEISKYVPDLLAERGMKTINKLFGVWLAISLLVPAAIGYAIVGTWQGAFTALLWGGAIRIFLLHHVTFSINSICHFWGRRNFKSSDESRNVWLLSLISFGESWHNNHHAFPTSAFHGMRKLEAAHGSRRLGDHRAREARARLEGRAHPARPPGREDARLADRPGVAGGDERLQVGDALGVVELRLHERVVALALDVAEDAERDDAVRRVRDA